jgi:SUMO ligase MMS21 Smc5/6 complex component
VDNFDREYKDLVQEAKKNAGKAKDSDKYKNFSSEIDKLKAIEIAAASQMNLLQNDDDFEMGEEDVLKMIDPFNKQQIIHPIRNTKCNHIYEESAVREAIKVNRNTRCPYMGCNNKVPIQDQYLEVDNVLRKRIEDAQTQQQLQRGLESGESDDDE